jgi:hypothetical protein
VITAGPPYRRAVPPRLDDEQRDRLRWLLQDPDHWVLRNSWERYLRTGDDRLLITTDNLTQDQCIAARSWLRQQQHALYRALEGDSDAGPGTKAPDGWLESLPMVQAFADRRHPTWKLREVPDQPGGPATND